MKEIHCSHSYMTRLSTFKGMCFIDNLLCTCGPCSCNDVTKTCSGDQVALWQGIVLHQFSQFSCQFQLPAITRPDISTYFILLCLPFVHQHLQSPSAQLQYPQCLVLQIILFSLMKVTVSYRVCKPPISLKLKYLKCSDLMCSLITLQA